MNVRVHSLIAYAAICATAVACSRSSPVAPGAAASAALLQGQQASASTGAPSKGYHGISTAGATISLLAGSVSIVNTDGDGISGTYTGSAQLAADGTETASLIVTISGGSGAFNGAAGRFAMTGSGSLADEGDFALNASGDMTIAGQKSAVVMIGLRGTSAASCDGSGHIAIAARGAGVMGRAGRVSATLHHQLGSSGCTP